MPAAGDVWPSAVLAAFHERPGAAADVLQLGEMADPEPGPGEVRVRVTLSGVNPGDTKKRGDWLGYGMPFPRNVPHSDGSGVIDAVGDGVERGRVGQRVRRRAGTPRPSAAASCGERDRPQRRAQLAAIAETNRRRMHYD
jgi:NADPH:quinone reductase